MEIIKVPFELLSDIINENIDIEVDGVKYWFHTDYGDSTFKDTVTKTIIFERENYPTATNPDKLYGYFGIDIVLTDYGNELEESFNDCYMYPYKMKEQIIQTFTRIPYMP